MPASLLRCAGLAAVIGGAAAAELAPSADLGGVPDVAPRTWFLFNAAPDDKAVSAQVPRRREIVIGASRPLAEEGGLGVHVEGAWSPVRAAREEPPARVDELLAGIGASYERPGEAFAWRLSATLGLRWLTDLKTAEWDRFEHRLLRGDDYRSEGQEEDPDTVDPLIAANWTGLVRLTDSDPLRGKPIDLAIHTRALRLLPLDRDEDDGDLDLRLGATLLLPSRTTVSWFGLTWQRLGQPDGGSRALAAADDQESGWWFASGGALRVGSAGAWLVEVGSAVDLASGVAVGTVGAQRTGDPPRAADPGTSSLEMVVLHGGNGLSAGIASGDQLKAWERGELRSEIRTLVGDRHEPAGAVTADALRLDALLRGQLPFAIGQRVRLGPEAAIGLGLRRDAVEFPDRSFAATNRLEATGDIGIAGRVSTSWQDGIAALGASLGWSWWQALGGDERLAAQGSSIELDSSGSGLVLRVGMMATF